MPVAAAIAAGRKAYADGGLGQAVLHGLPLVTASGTGGG
jgi:hypothetical protein